MVNKQVVYICQPPSAGRLGLFPSPTQYTSKLPGRVSLFPNAIKCQPASHIHYRGKCQRQTPWLANTRRGSTGNTGAHAMPIPAKSPVWTAIYTQCTPLLSLQTPKGSGTSSTACRRFSSRGHAVFSATDRCRGNSSNSGKRTESRRL